MSYDPADFACLDCGTDTLAAGEYYMVRNDVWQDANPDVDGMLCLGCLEGRLGRRLTAADFTDAPLNTGCPGYYRGPRMRDRTAA